MKSNILLTFTGVLGLIASRQTEARELTSLKARHDSITPIFTTLTTPIISVTTKLAETLTVSPLVEVSATIICNIGHPKSQIKSFLTTCNDLVTAKANIFKSLSTTTDASNAADVGVEIQGHLNTIVHSININVANIQKCGIDPSPTIVDLGVSHSDVSQSAFQVVLNLQPIFEIVSNLSTKFSVIENSCGKILFKLSIALSNLVGACSEQVNLFDTGFFKLTKPHMNRFSSMGGNFDAFSGSFI